MSSDLVFMMGKYRAHIPTDRHYAKNHMWGKRQSEGLRFGFTSYAVRLMQDVYFLDWIVEAEAELSDHQQIGAIESKKAESDLFAPIQGCLKRLNHAVLADPSLINADQYGAGWLFEMEGSAESLFTPRQYLEHLHAVWEVTQCMIKRQWNQ